MLYQQIFFTTMAIAFGMLHLMLYLYNRRLRSNLYFAIFALLYAIGVFFDYQASMAPNALDELFYLRIHRAVSPYSPIFVLLFIYSLSNSRIPKQFWFISAALVITGIFAVINPHENFEYIQLLLIVVLIEAVRLMISGIRRKEDGAWIISAGFGLLFVFSSYDLLMDLGLITPYRGILNGSPFGFVCLIILMSVYLARDFAKTNERMLAEERRAKELEIEQRLLEAEDARKSKELQDARELQLAMLPQCINEVGGFDICFDMRPATEVGGDFYDYHLAEDGTLTIAIGDATGHGMKAGIMVSIIKSLFIADDSQSGITTFFKKCTRSIKQMHLGNLYMALMLIRIKDSRMTVSSAGMPPLWIYRQADGTSEDMVIKGMPLGAFEDFPYQTASTELAPGDAILLMSDGLSELFNHQEEMLGDSRIAETFRNSAKNPPAQIVEKLYALGDQWRGNLPQEDDITLMVLKKKE